MNVLVIVYSYIISFVVGIFAIRSERISDTFTAIWTGIACRIHPIYFAYFAAWRETTKRSVISIINHVINLIACRKQDEGNVKPLTHVTPKLDMKVTWWWKPRSQSLIYFSLEQKKQKTWNDVINLDAYPFLFGIYRFMQWCTHYCVKIWRYRETAAGRHIYMYTYKSTQYQFHSPAHMWMKVIKFATSLK